MIADYCIKKLRSTYAVSLMRGIRGPGSLECSGLQLTAPKVFNRSNPIEQSKSPLFILFNFPLEIFLSRIAPHCLPLWSPNPHLLTRLCPLSYSQDTDLILFLPLPLLLLSLCRRKKVDGCFLDFFSFFFFQLF